MSLYACAHRESVYHFCLCMQNTRCNELFLSLLNICKLSLTNRFHRNKLERMPLIVGSLCGVCEQLDQDLSWSFIEEYTNVQMIRR